MGLGRKTKTRLENLVAWVLAVVFLLLMAVGGFFTVKFLLGL